MSWQVEYAVAYILEYISEASVHPIRDDSIRITIPERPDIIAVISAEYTINAELVTQYRIELPNMDFLCGYRKECVWEGDAIRHLESNSIGWGSAGTLYSAICEGNANTASHKDYFFSYRLIRQMNVVSTTLNREFDRVFTMTLRGRTWRVGMLKEYEPTADSLRTFWDRFGPIDIAWCINPNGRITQRAFEAAQALGCQLMYWNDLREFLQTP